MKNSVLIAVVLIVSLLVSGTAFAQDIGVVWSGKSGMTKRVMAGFEQGMKGATWTDRVGVVAATGSFDSISRLAIGDISFDVEVNDHGMVSMEVVIPLGAAVQWPQLVAPMSPDQRAESARAFDPDGRIKALGSTFKLLIDLPSDVVATGITPHLLGVTASSEGDEAKLLVSVDTALAAHGSLRWHVTWMR